MNRRPQSRLKIAASAIFIGALACIVAAQFLWHDHVTADVVVAMIVLGALSALASNFEIEVEARIAISGHVMVATASLVVFYELDFLLGALIVGLFGGLYLPHLREKKFAIIAINAGSDCVGLFAGALVFSLLGEGHPTTIELLAPMIVASVAFLAVNCLMLSWPISLARGEKYGVVAAQMGRANASAFPFAMLGLGVGWVYLDLGAWVVPLLVVPVIIARQAFASYLQLKTAQENTIETLIRALEAKDRYTAGHAQRVAMFSSYIAEEFAFGPRRAERLRYAALMHDIGKLVVPNQLLNKPGRLTEAEFDRVRLHESVSVELLRRIDFLAPVAGDTTTEAASAAVGGGLVEPAIIHVADAFDAMTSTRSYRRALSQETAFDELRKGAGTQFNGDCVDALITALERRGESYGAGHEVDDHEWAVAPPEAGTGSAGLGHLVAEEQGAQP